MAINIAINGFGRIGRAFLRSILLDSEAKKKLNIVAINIGHRTQETLPTYSNMIQLCVRFQEA